MSVALLPKYQIVPGEDPDITAAKLHAKKNRPANPAEDLEFPAYRYRPYPRVVYRQWDDEDRDRELMRVAGKQMLDLEKKRDRYTAEALVGEHETRGVGVIDYEPHDTGDEILSALRERNDKEFASLLEQGWADSPDGVRAATRRVQMRVAASAADRWNDDAKLGEKAKAELEAIDAAADDHVVDVPETRKQLQAEGKLPKEKK